jgi:hypothetical protein
MVIINKMSWSLAYLTSITGHGMDHIKLFIRSQEPMTIHRGQIYPHLTHLQQILVDNLFSLSSMLLMRIFVAYDDSTQFDIL